jgi:spectinomycin phosphotransferase
MPLGLDANSAVYRARADDGAFYFVKLRRGVFDELSVTLPRLLNDAGISQAIRPLATKTGRLWSLLAESTLIAYPYIDGVDGYGVDFSERHWRDFGTALKQLHTTNAPSEIIERVQRETYSPTWRDAVTQWLKHSEKSIPADPIAAQLSALLDSKRAAISELIHRTNLLGAALQSEPLEFVLCHADMHAGNLLIDTNDRLYIVDWDSPILAPKERDLMFVGGGQGFRGHSPDEEVTLFNAGYGAVEVNQAALAYYRCERIVQDIEAFCREIFMTTGDGEDRRQALVYLKANFRPGGVLEIANSTAQKVETSGI